MNLTPTNSNGQRNNNNNNNNAKHYLDAIITIEGLLIAQAIALGKLPSPAQKKINFTSYNKLNDSSTGYYVINHAKN